MNKLQKFLDSIGLSKSEASKRYKIPDRTLRSWCGDAPPSNVAKLVMMMLDLIEKERLINMWQTTAELSSEDIGKFSCLFRLHSGKEYIGEFNMGEFLGVPNHEKNSPLTTFSIRQVKEFKLI